MTTSWLIVELGRMLTWFSMLACLAMVTYCRPLTQCVAMRETLAVGCMMVSNLSRGPHLGDNGRI